MAKIRIVRVMQQKNGQMMLTIPRPACLAYELKKGDPLKVEFIHKNGRIAGLRISKAV